MTNKLSFAEKWETTAKNMQWKEVHNLGAIVLDCDFPRRHGLIVADYSFLQVAKMGNSSMDENYELAYGTHRIAYAMSTPTGDIVNFVQFTGYLHEMPKAFERYYELPDHVWAKPNARGIATSKNIVSRVVSLRLSSMTETEDA